MVRNGRLVLVDEVSGLKSKAPHRLELTFAHPAPLDAFRRVPGVLSLSADENILHCAMEGTVDPFLKVVSRFEVINITSHEPDLEEIFLDYYRGSQGSSESTIKEPGEAEEVTALAA